MYEARTIPQWFHSQNASDVLDKIIEHYLTGSLPHVLTAYREDFENREIQGGAQVSPSLLPMKSKNDIHQGVC